LARARAQDREIAEHGFEILSDTVRIAARVCAHAQIILDREQRKDFATFRHMRDSSTHDLSGDRPWMSSPRNFTWPLRGSMIPEMVFSVVVLPAPLARARR